MATYPFAGDPFTNAQAQAKWASDYVTAIKDNALQNVAIATAQQVAAFYFADKQFDIANKAQNRLDKIADEQLLSAGELRTQYEYIMLCERQAADDACQITQYTPDYTGVQSRTIGPIFGQFAKLKEQNAICASVNCGAASCASDRQLSIAQAIATNMALEGAYRKEEALAEARNRRELDDRLKMLQHMRGLATASATFLAGATATANIAAGINPHAGYAAAVGGGLQRIGNALQTLNTADVLGRAQLMDYGAMQNSVPTINSSLSSGYEVGYTDAFSNIPKNNYSMGSGQPDDSFSYLAGYGSPNPVNIPYSQPASTDFSFPSVPNSDGS